MTKLDQFLVKWIGLQLVVFGLLLFEAFGCATLPPSEIHIADDAGCKTHLICEKRVGDKCVNLKITLDGNCEMETTGSGVSRGKDPQ